MVCRQMQMKQIGRLLGGNRWLPDGRVDFMGNFANLNVLAGRYVENRRERGEIFSCPSSHVCFQILGILHAI